MFYDESFLDVAKCLKSDVNKGLNLAQVNERLKKYGYNELKREKKKTFLNIFLSQFQDLLIIILICASIISFFVGEHTDCIVILLIVFLNAILSAFQENKANNALEKLKNLSMPHAKVIRDGKRMVVSTSEIVLGDIVEIESGDFVPSDGRLIEEVGLKVDESSLTGESVAVEKHIDIIDKEDITYVDMNNMVFSSCIVTHGKGKYITTATGMNSQIGNIASMLKNDKKKKTPLEEKIDTVGKYLSIGCLLLCVIIFAIGFFYGKDPLMMFLTSISLAVAAIPEGLPAVITIVLALGVSRLSKQNALIRKMHAVETLGSASVICSDKTGTLTQNKMSVEKVCTYDEIIDKKDFENNDDKAFKMICTVCLNNNDATVENDNGKNVEIGDTTEIALLKLAKKSGMDCNKKDRIMEIPFDSNRKLMTTVHEYNGKYIAYVKGASDVLINKCVGYVTNGEVEKLNYRAKMKYMALTEDMSAMAYRVLGFAYRVFDKMPNKEAPDLIEDRLVFIGLTAMIDPPRKEALNAIDICKKAGIKPIMITGDHILTARAIGKKLNIASDDSECILGVELDRLSDEEFSKKVKDYSVYARVSPENKVRIVNALKANGEVVAMTGDGVNDAPALKEADIGCAMGITGSDVAKDAADMVLRDDNFATIVTAVREGRGIFLNIKKAIHFLLSCNIGEIFTLFIATIFNMDIPLLPIHILWVNLVTDSLPAIALGMDRNSKDIMKEKPIPRNRNIFSGGLGIIMIIQGCLIGIVTLAAFFYGKVYYSLEEARTMAFLVLCLSQLVHTFNVRSGVRSVVTSNPFDNLYLIGADIVSALLALIVVFVPFLRGIFMTAVLSKAQWDLILTLTLIPIIISEIIKVIIYIFNLKPFYK